MGVLLQNQEKYDEAITKYELSDLDAAEEALPYCYYEWVSQLISKTEYDNAVTKYFELLEIYPDSTWSSFENSIILGRLPDGVLFNLGAKYQQQNSDDFAILLMKTFYKIILKVNMFPKQ